MFPRFSDEINTFAKTGLGDWLPVAPGETENWYPPGQASPVLAEELEATGAEVVTVVFEED